ncbi:unnamed protein product, partial [Polarella glacialis]
VQVVDLGVIAGTAPKTNACFWLSFIAAASHVLGPDHQAPDMAIWTALREDLAAVRETEASHLQHAARNGPRVDAVGTAADYLRRYACDRMATADGCERWQPWFANLAGDVNAPEGGGASLVQYMAHVAGLRTHIFADQLNVVQVSEMFGIRIKIIPKDETWAITTINADADKCIFLGNDDTHYVWLKPTDV